MSHIKNRVLCEPFQRSIRCHKIFWEPFLFHLDGSKNICAPNPSYETFPRFFFSRHPEAVTSSITQQRLRSRKRSLNLPTFYCQIKGESSWVEEKGNKKLIENLVQTILTYFEHSRQCEQIWRNFATLAIFYKYLAIYWRLR